MAGSNLTFREARCEGVSGGEDVVRKSARLHQLHLTLPTEPPASGLGSALSLDALMCPALWSSWERETCNIRFHFQNQTIRIHSINSWLFSLSVPLCLLCKLTDGYPVFPFSRRSSSSRSDRNYFPLVCLIYQMGFGVFVC